MPKKRSKYVLRHLRHKKTIFVKQLGGKCVRCGYNKNLSALEFHHIGNKGNRGIENWRAPGFKLEQCILLCANCHREEHNPHLTNYLDETDLELSKKIKEGLRKKQMLEDSFRDIYKIED